MRTMAYINYQLMSERADTMDSECVYLINRLERWHRFNSLENNVNIHVS